MNIKTVSPLVEVTKLGWHDEVLAAIELPKGVMTITRGVGSGLSATPGSRGIIWAIGDRGPNLKPSVLSKHYGVEDLEAHHDLAGAKIMPRPDLGPALICLRLDSETIEAERVLLIRDQNGTAISGLPTPGGVHAASEPALDVVGARLGTDPSGADTEGLITLRDGFWVGDEYGPSLLRLDADGRIIVRWVPVGTADQFRGARYPVEERLPAIAARRHINRGFEAIGLSSDERRLYLSFQSPLAHPTPEVHKAAVHVRIWTLDAATGALLAQHLYPLDPPERFRRDTAEGSFTKADVKLSELVVLDDGRLLCLERGSASTKFYLVALDPARALPAEHLDPATRPTVEEISASDPASLPALSKTLLLDTDDYPEIGRDLEGMALLAPDEMLLVSDNDFGVEGAESGFWRVRFSQPLTDY